MFANLIFRGGKFRELLKVQLTIPTISTFCGENQFRERPPTREIRENSIPRRIPAAVYGIYDAGVEEFDTVILNPRRNSVLGIE